MRCHLSSMRQGVPCDRPALCALSCVQRNLCGDDHMIDNRTFIPELWSKHLLQKFYDASLMIELFPSPKPTGMERLKWKLRDFKTRISTACKILTGKLDPYSFEDY